MLLFWTPKVPQVFRLVNTLLRVPPTFPHVAARGFQFFCSQFLSPLYQLLGFFFPSLMLLISPEGRGSREGCSPSPAVTAVLWDVGMGLVPLPLPLPGSWISPRVIPVALGVSESPVVPPKDMRPRGWLRSAALGPSPSVGRSLGESLPEWGGQDWALEQRGITPGWGPRGAGEAAPCPSLGSTDTLCQTEGKHQPSPPVLLCPSPAPRPPPPASPAGLAPPQAPAVSPRAAPGSQKLSRAGGMRPPPQPAPPALVPESPLMLRSSTRPRTHPRPPPPSPRRGGRAAPRPIRYFREFPAATPAEGRGRGKDVHGKHPWVVLGRGNSAPTGCLFLPGQVGFHVKSNSH